MSEPRDGGAAFPRPHSHCEFAQDECIQSNFGMTLRDYFAAKVMASLIVNPRHYADDEVARIAYKQADAMLAERAKS